MFSLKSPFLPDPRLLVEFIQRKRHARIAATEEQGMIRQWFLLYGPAEKEWLLNPKPATLRKLLPPNDRSWADPFLWRHGDDWFIFCEEWIWNQPHAHLAVIPLAQDGGAMLSSAPVLVKDHHLSYPFLFEHERTLYMLPEGGRGRALEVYQCDEFPTRWHKRATLMRDLDYADATLLQAQAKWWLFVTIKRGLYKLNRDLFLFWADSTLADAWSAHPANPVVRGLKHARPAGRIFEVGGRLFRPSQDNLARYGYGLRINEILRLDTKYYQERLVTEVAPTWEANVCGNHHIDWQHDMVVMDAQRLIQGAAA